MRREQNLFISADGPTVHLKSHFIVDEKKNLSILIKGFIFLDLQECSYYQEVDRQKFVIRDSW